MKFATIRSSGDQFYGAVTDEGVIDLSDNFPQWQCLKEVIEHGGLPLLEEAATGRDVSHANGSFTFDMPVSNGEKIICVGVNFPD